MKTTDVIEDLFSWWEKWTEDYHGSQISKDLIAQRTLESLRESWWKGSLWGWVATLELAWGIHVLIRWCRDTIGDYMELTMEWWKWHKPLFRDVVTALSYDAASIIRWSEGVHVYRNS
jgi:hypothetical protein